MKENSHKVNRVRRGYLLLTVVVMIAVASLMLARTASQSMRAANVAIENEREMRSRWAVTSLRRFTLDHADDLIATIPIGAATSAGESDAIMWRDVELAGHTWRIILADESAKLNLNHAAKQQNFDFAEAALGDLLSGGHALRTSHQLDGEGFREVMRWETWLEGQGSHEFLSPRVIASATQRVTLWGNGKLNVLASDPQTVDVLWRQLFGRAAPSRLGELRQQTPPPGTREVIAALGLRESQADLANRWLQTDSTCHSVWVFCQSDRRVSPTFYVEWGPERVREHRGYEY